MRNGTVIAVTASELVPGDIAMLKTGEQTPADIRLLECSKGFTVDQSAMNPLDLELVAKNTDVTTGNEITARITTSFFPPKLFMIRSFLYLSNLRRCIYQALTEKLGRVT